MLTRIFLAFLCINGIMWTLFLLKSLFFRPISILDHMMLINTKTNNNNMETSSIVGKMENFLANKYTKLYGYITWLNNDAHNKNNNDEILERMMTNESNLQTTTIFIRANNNNQNNDDDDCNQMMAIEMQMLNIQRQLFRSTLGYLQSIIYQVKYLEQNQCEIDSISQDENEFESTSSSLMTIKLCAKIIDLQLLRKQIDQINGIPATLLTCLLLQRKYEIKRSLIMATYYRQYEYFRKVCRKFLNSQKITEKNDHLLYYEQIIVDNDEQTINLNRRGRRHKVFENIHQNQQSCLLPNQILLIMPMAIMNLKQAIHDHSNGLPLTVTKTYSRQIIDGLEFLHKQINIAHLNLKPENILFFIDNNDDDTKNEIRYCLKLTDIIDNYLLPANMNHVQTLSPFDCHVNHYINYTISPLFVDYYHGRYCHNNDDDDDNHCGDNIDVKNIQFKHDLYCYTMTVLLMIIGYKEFERKFICTQSPYRIKANPLHQYFPLLIERIKSSTLIPAIFIDWFECHLSSLIDNHMNSMDILTSMMKHKALCEIRE